MEIKIEKYDHQARGIGYVNDKITFVEKTVPGDIVDVEIIKENKKYIEAEIIDIKLKSTDRTKSKCPYFENCGGCQLRNTSYDNTLNFKRKKVEEILKKYADAEPSISIIKNKQKDFYRNKIELQVKNGIYGFFEKNTHKIIEVDRCINAEESINTVLRIAADVFHIINGLITIKSNYNDEIIINVSSTDEQKIDIDSLRTKCKLVGILWNDKLIYGADHYIEIIDDMFFKETYNSFFQVNRYINRELFKLIEENIEKNMTVLDMCSGVGTLSLVASKKAKSVYGIEIIENAVKDALINAKMNKRENVHFLLGDAYKMISKIEENIDTIIIDPPRSGLNDEAIKSILNIYSSRIIYISCNPITLARDISILKTKYEISKFYILDMFSYTFHVECVCVLSGR